MRQFKALGWSGVLAAGLVLAAGCDEYQGRRPDEVETSTPEEQVTPETVYQNLFGLPEGVALAPSYLAPSNAGDAENIVRSDNISLFDKAETVFQQHVAAHPDDFDARAWQAQLYLVWGERARDGAAFLTRAQVNLDEQVKEIDQRLKSGTYTDRQKQGLADAVTVARMEMEAAETVRKDLLATAMQRIEKGAALATELAKQKADSYLGWRLLADAYRILGDWEHCAEAVAKVRELNPDSIGLSFLEGAVALQKDHNAQTAIAHLNKAVEQDPTFAKAWFYLALAQLEAGQPAQAREALIACLQVSPGHHLARGVKNLLESADLLKEQAGTQGG